MDEPAPRPRLPARILRGVAVVAVALLAAGAATTAYGSTSQDIGPLETRLAVVLSLDGGVSVGVPPLGRLDLPTHRGPLQVRASVTSIEPSRARALLRANDPGRTVSAQVTADSQDALAAAAAKCVLVALLGSGLVLAVVFRRRRAVLGGTAAVAAVLAASAAVAGLTLRTQGLNEPRFDGLLEQAPALVGRVQNFGAYSERVAQLTANVARVYGSLATLPVSPGADSTRVLWVSDIHLNPEAFAVMRQLSDQFDVQAIVDTGDLVDLGSQAENRLITQVSSFDLPYLFVRGNHDSAAITQFFLGQQPGVEVLDDGAVVQVGGVRFTGTGDPVFRPNKEVGDESDVNDAALRAAGEDLAEDIEAASEPVDVALVHEPTMAEPLFGRVPLVLDGHTHERSSRVADGTLELTQGSSGGAGLRTLDRGDAQELQMSVLHFDAEGGLLAVDDITIGGLGQRSVTVERRTPESYDGALEQPDGAAPSG